MPRKSGLGSGLTSLLHDNSATAPDAVEVRLSDIEPNPDQPRKAFDPQALEELTENIRQYGLLQPLIVRPVLSGGYQIVAGERRWRACRQAGLKTVPVIIKDLSDAQTMEIALIENLQREDLNGMEEAKGYKQLMDTFGLTQEQVAQKIGKSRSAVANTLRLLELGKYTELIENGVITAGHGRALLALPKEMRDTAVQMIQNGATVRQIEQLAKTAKQASKKQTTDSTAPVKARKPVYFSEAELALKESLGRKVQIDFQKNKGTLQIEFYSEADLRDLLQTYFSK